MINLQKDYLHVIKAEVAALREAGEDLGVALCGPTAVPDDSGELTFGWMVQIMLRTEDEDFHAAVPIAGINPSRDVFALAVDHLLKTVRVNRDEAENDSPMAFSFHCVGQRGDENGNPVGPALYSPDHPDKE